MIKKFIIYLSVILTIFSCYNSGPKKPKNLISKDNMVNILIDARLLASANIKDKDTMKAHGIEIDSYVFEKHNIDSLQFALSNNYYAYNIKEYKEIYDHVVDSLEKLEAFFKELDLKEERKKKKKEEDSINSLKLTDSLKTAKMKDSLTTRLLKNKTNKKEEGVLITPVSETTSQSRK